MRYRAAIALLAILSMFAAACSSDDSGDTTETTTAGAETTEATETTVAAEEEGGTLQVVRFESFDGWVLDSAAAWSTYQSHLAVIEPLLRFGADGKSLADGLAEEWNYDPEALTIAFTLKENARFSNGDPVTAEDVAFSLGVWTAGPNFGISFETIVGVTGEGSEVVLELAYPDNTILPLMASSVSGIMPKDFAGMTEDEYYANPIGAGAYKIDEWSTGGRMVFTANEYFYDPERPYFDTVVTDVIADETERQILFDGGEADLIEYLSATAAPRYDAASVYQCTTHATAHVGLNVFNPPLDDLLVRQAIAYAIDYDQVSAALGTDYFEPPSGIMAPNIWNWAPPTKPYYRLDLAKAKDLLAQSSAPDGGSLELVYDSGSDEDTLVAQVFQSNLAELGFDLELTGLETLAFIDAAWSLESDMAMWTYGAIQPDSADPMNWIMATVWLFSGYETDTLLDQFFAYAEAETPADQEAIVAQIQDDAIDAAAAIAYAQGSYLHAVNPDLSGFWSAPWGLYYYDTISG